jgi:hypothetical protein
MYIDEPKSYTREVREYYLERYRQKLQHRTRGTGKDAQAEVDKAQQGVMRECEAAMRRAVPSSMAREWSCLFLGPLQELRADTEELVERLRAEVR